MKDLFIGQEPAFPEPFLNDPNLALSCAKGMSKRFYAACAAMQGIISLTTSSKVVRYEGQELTPPNVAKAAFLYADELLKQEQQNETNS